MITRTPQHLHCNGETKFMKKIRALILAGALFTTCMLSSCSLTDGSGILGRLDPDKFADDYIAKFVSAINENNSEELVGLFTRGITEKFPDIKSDADRLTEFVEGEIISYTTAKDNGIATSKHAHYGKVVGYVNAAFSMETSDGNLYHVGFILCNRDDYGRDTGIVCIGIVDGRDWPFESVYGVSYEEEGIIIEQRTQI